MSSWLDLINVGLNAAQSAQIHQAQEQLQRMEAEAAEAALREQVLEVMRNYIFEIAQDIKALEEQLQQAPQQVYVVAHALRWRLENLGVTPEIFSEFADKEYVQQTQTKIRSAIQQSQTMMTAEQHTQADQAVRFIKQSDLLQDAIEAESAKENLQASEPEWEALKKKLNSTQGKKALGCLGLVMVFSVIPAVLAGIAISLASVNELLGTISGLVGFVVWIGCLVGSIVLMAKSKPNRYEELKETRAEWENQLMPQERWDQVVALWGERSSQGYQEVQDSRNGFIRGIFGQVEGFDKFLPVG
jgi:hypothetical protein